MQSEPVRRECPHCGAHAELLPVAPPTFRHLDEARPRHAGIVFECSACHEPRFARVAVRSFGPDAIELSQNVVEIERARERFNVGYLPDAVSTAFMEALDCYTADLLTAFGVMSRRAVQIAMTEARTNGGPDFEALFAEAAQIADIDPDTARTLQTLLFDAAGQEPALDSDSAAVLIELFKDLFYQAYVRRSRLRAAVRMRRHFAGETTQKITPIGMLRRPAGSG